MLSSLFISNSRRKAEGDRERLGFGTKTGKKSAFTILGIVVLVAFIGFVIHILNYVYVDDYIDGNNREFWHDYYSYEDDIDSICVGSSHVLCDVDPAMMDSVTGRKFYDMSTTAVPLNGSYYLIKECLKTHDIKHVYLEMYHFTTVDAIEDDVIVDKVDSQIRWNWRNTDYMKPSFNRLAYKLTMGDTSDYISIFFPFTRYRSKLFTENGFDIDYVKNGIKAKQGYDYITYNDYVSDDDTVTYYRGFQHSNQQRIAEEKTYYPSVDLGERSIGVKTRDYIDKIAKLCSEKDIELTLFISPMDRLQLMATGDYDRYNEQIREIANEYNLDFYDFNLVKEEYLDICNDENMLDFEHLNAKGAAEFSKFFAKVITSDRSERDKYFYGSFKEALENSPVKIYGIFGGEFFKDDNDRWNRYNTIVCSHKEGMEYKLVTTASDGNKNVIQDYSSNTEFTLCVDEGGLLTIYARNVNNKQEDEINIVYHN